jgi:uncharacterized iron-regulated membrane protein
MAYIHSPEIENRQMKRLLFETHRWVGIVLASFMLLWFFSGLVIIYAEPTTPSRAQQLAHAESLLPDAGWLSAGEAWERSAAQRKELASKKAASGANKGQGAADKKIAEAGNKKPGGGGENQIVEARLQQQAGEPLWLIEDGKGQRFALSAIDGTLHQTSAEQALKIAETWVSRNADNAVASVKYAETIEKPAILRNYDARPFHKFTVDDGAGSELLISARTGEVVHASTRIERGFYWVGNWLHLFRPLELTGLSESRVDVLTWTAFAAAVASLTGLIVGWLRWRPGLFGKKTYSAGRVHPYHHFWAKWHFWGGLLGGTLALTWGLSGFLNNNPWQLFSPANPSKEELIHYVGGEDLALARSWRPAPLVGVDGDVVELGWRRLGDETVQLAYTRDGRRLPQASAGTDTNFSDTSLQAAVHRMVGDVPVATQTVLQQYDSYYYLRFHRDAADRPLPVVRVELADAVGTHLYIDPQDGRLLAKQDRSRRVFRWLYSALHHWDFGWLYQRPLWDGWMLTWVLLGLVLSVSAVVIGWKRLVITFRPKHRNAIQADVPQNAEPPRLATENQAG